MNMYPVGTGHAGFQMSHPEQNDSENEHDYAHLTPQQQLETYLMIEAERQDARNNTEYRQVFRDLCHEATQLRRQLIRTLRQVGCIRSRQQQAVLRNQTLHITSLHT